MSTKQTRLNGISERYFQSVRNSFEIWLASSQTLEKRVEATQKHTDDLLTEPRISKRVYGEYADRLRSAGVNTHLPGAYPVKKTRITEWRNNYLQYQRHLSGIALEQLIVYLALTFETFLFAVFRKFFVEDPRRLKPFASKLNITEAIEGGLLSDNDRLVAIATDNLVRYEFMKSSIPQVIMDIEKHLKIDLSVLEKEIKIVGELFLVRNSIMHNSKLVTKELIENNRHKYLGLQKLELTSHDYKSYRAACSKVVRAIAAQYSERYAKKFNYVSIKESVLAHASRISQGTVVKRGSLYFNLSPDVLTKLTIRYQSADLAVLRQMLMSEIFEMRYISAQILLNRFATSTSQGKTQIYAFMILNINLLKDTLIIDKIGSKILASQDIEGFSVENKRILRSLASSPSYNKARLLLQILIGRQDMDVNYRRWLIKRVETSVMPKVTAKDQKRALRRLITRAS